MLHARAAYVALAVATIACGLVVHFLGAAHGILARDFIGDALWAMMIAWLLGAISPTARLRTRSIAAVGICFVVEATQLYHTRMLDALRGTTVGHLVLGSGFDPRDFAAYAVGVLGAALLERAVRGTRPVAA